MYKKASSELVVARRRRGSDNSREHVGVAAADRVQGPLGEDDGDDAVERDDRRVPQRFLLLCTTFTTDSSSNQTRRIPHSRSLS